jgi:hypothetical protein
MAQWNVREGGAIPSLGSKYHFEPDGRQYPISASTSRRDLSSSRNTPMILDVVITTPGVDTPRAVMQAWVASITTELR